VISTNILYVGILQVQFVYVSQVQAYVGSAKGGLMDAWFFQPNAHLQNSLDLLHYYKYHCRCNHDNHIDNEGQHRHFPPRRPPPLIDCVLLYARLKGYDTELYIVDKAYGELESDTDAILHEKCAKWRHLLMAETPEWGLNVSQPLSAYVVDFQQQTDCKALIKAVTNMWKQQMKIGPLGKVAETIKTVIKETFGGEHAPYVFDGIFTVRTAIDNQIRLLEKLQVCSIYISVPVSQVKTSFNQYIGAIINKCNTLHSVKKLSA
jgi:hypothetical protein